MPASPPDRQVSYSRDLLSLIPAPIWIENWTEVERFCDEQRAAGVEDIVARLGNDLDLLREVVATIDVTGVSDATVDFVGAPSQETMLGGIPVELLTETALKSFLPQIDAVWRGLDRTSLMTGGIDLGGADINCELSWAARSVDGVVDYSEVVILLRDIAGYVASERRMTGHIKRLTQLLDMGRGMSATLDTNLIMQLLLISALDLLGADRSLIILVDGEEVTTIHEDFTDSDPGAEPFRIITEWLSDEVTSSRRGLVSADVATDLRIGGGARVHAARLPGVAVAVVPIISDELSLGTLAAGNGPGRPRFTAFDLSVLEALASQAAVAIRNVEFYEELKKSRDSAHEAHEALKATQSQLLSAQKMEAIGSLAAGIAHEINTPIQFVSDNTAFVRDGIATLARITKAQARIVAGLDHHPDVGPEVASLKADWESSDCDFLLDEIPAALEETTEGANRVAEIVRAMKDFAHPGSASKETVDVNHVVTTTAALSKNEWKYVAELELDLTPDLPPIQGFPGPLGQSLLVLLVNAAQAFDEHRNIDRDGKGVITVITSHTDSHVEIRVADNGPGIPDGIKERIFEPFFTTKEVGNGSGQGLSIAHSVVVDKHEGRIWLEDGDPGSVFVIQLPL